MNEPLPPDAPGPPDPPAEPDAPGASDAGLGEPDEPDTLALADESAESLGVEAPPVESTSEPAPLTREGLAQLRARPTYVFFGVLAGVALLLDIASKAWAEVVLSARTLDDPSIVLIDDHLLFTLAYNRGGAWGLLHDASEAIRRPFFLGVSLLAIAFIVSLYSRLAPGQRALKWGLPLVLGGALGNLSDRIIRSSVVDFIDYRADWIEAMNRGIAKLYKTWTITDHWPTFNVADIFICIGVGLMAVDMITSRRKHAEPGAKPAPDAAAPEPEGLPAAPPPAEAAAPSAERTT